MSEPKPWMIILGANVIGLFINCLGFFVDTVSTQQMIHTMMVGQSMMNYAAFKVVYDNSLMEKS